MPVPLGFVHLITADERRADAVVVTLVSPILVSCTHPGYPCATVGDDGILISGPDGYKYKAIPPIEGRAERFVSVGLRVSDLSASVAYWCDLLGMSKNSQPAPGSEGALSCETVGYGDEQVC